LSVLVAVLLYAGAALTAQQGGGVAGHKRPEKPAIDPNLPSIVVW
jgi:hypothetical protein